MSNRGAKVSKPKDRRQKAKKRSQISPLQVILGAATLVGGIVALLALIPRPTVSVSSPVDLDNVFSSAFTITNSNITPLTDVGVTVWPGKITIGKKGLVGQGEMSDASGGLVLEEWQHHYLRMDEQFTITLSDMFIVNPEQVGDCDVLIIVSYRPWFLPFHRSRAFRLKTHRQTDGHWYWYQTPLR